MTAKVLEWNLVVVPLRRPSRLWRRHRFSGASRPLALFSLASTASARPTSKHLHHFTDHLELLRSARLLVIPGIELQPAFDENRAPFLQIFTREFGRPLNVTSTKVTSSRFSPPSVV